MDEPINKVSVTDLDMPFFSMVRFMVKWAIAAIPALFILMMLGGIFWGLLLGFFVGIGSRLSHKPSVAANPASTGVKGSDTPTPPKGKEPEAIGVELLKKGFRASDAESGIYKDAILMSVAFKNLTGKDIRAFDGILTFLDLLGNEILSSKVAINEKIVVGGTYNWDGQLDYNQFMDSHVRLRGEEKSNLQIKFTIRKVLFADGTTKEYE
jgi:hypothetical protein